MGGQVRVLVVDDSAFMRKVLSDLLQSDPEVTVIGTARDGQDGVEKVWQLQPDVVTLDIEMPRLDGFGALEQILRHRSVPVVMVSSLTQEGADATIRALSMGAVDFVSKPSGSVSLNMYTVREQLVAKVKAAAQARPLPRALLQEFPLVHPEKRSGLVQAAAALQSGPAVASRKVVVIGCSTGGPGALHRILPELPADLGAGVLIVQHMPVGFTRSLARRLDEIAALRVKEAEEGDLVQDGLALIAPGGQHMTVDRDGRIRLNLDSALHGVRPAVDKTLESTVPVWGCRQVGVILTGMGYDGARGMVALKRSGGRTVAEDASTCVVYGMPRVVVEVGAADHVVPLPEIARTIVRLVREG